VDLRVKIKDREFSNPVGVASGTFGYAKEYELLVDLNSLGAIYTKAVTPEPRKGNAHPRMVETPAGMLNSIGLANVGVQDFMAKKVPFLDSLNPATVVNVSGAQIEDYINVVETLEASPGIWGYEINVSCPNVKEGGMAFGTSPKMVAFVTQELRKRTDRPLIVKLSPNVTDITEIALAAEGAGADGLSLINTLRGMTIDTRTKKAHIPNKIAGLSGPAVLPVGIAMVYQAAGVVKIPVVGLGGIHHPDHAIQYLLAGASAIQVGSGLFVDPRLPEKVLLGIKEYMDEQKFHSIKDFHGHL
jgi:dihydroorotate dehydrogenase (NAD+) catalytic subunit